MAVTWNRTPAIHTINRCALRTTPCLWIMVNVSHFLAWQFVVKYTNRHFVAHFLIIKNRTKEHAQRLVKWVLKIMPLDVNRTVVCVELRVPFLQIQINSILSPFKESWFVETIDISCKENLAGIRSKVWKI